MLVRYFMSTNVLTLSPEQKCIEAYHYLKEHQIRRAPVMDNDKIVGIVSEMDLYSVIPSTLLQASQETTEASENITIKDIMTTKVHVLNPNDHLELAAKMMLQHKIGGIPVLKDDQLEGLITESDIFEATWNILSQKTNHRILFFDKGPDTDKAPNDYIKMCLRRNFLVTTFISYPRPDEDGAIHYICIQGKEIDKLINDLWSHSCEVIFTEEYTPHLTDESE